MLSCDNKQCIEVLLLMLCTRHWQTGLWNPECVVQLHNFWVAGGCGAKTQISLLPVAMPWGTG